MLECKLKLVMVELNVDQIELAKLSGLSRETINRLANNKVQSPSLETAFILSSALKVPIERIWTYKA
jgi:DNA-binding XRE family transcriptional regulator